MNKYVKLHSIALACVLLLQAINGFSQCLYDRTASFDDIRKYLDKKAYKSLKAFERLLPYPRNLESKPAAVVPLIVHPYLGSYMSDGRLVLPISIQLHTIQQLMYNRSLPSGSFYTKEYSVYMDVASGNPDPNKVLFHFESLLLYLWKLWHQEHALSITFKHQETLTDNNPAFSKILQSDGLLTVTNCQQHQVFKSDSIGYALLSVIANYVQQQRLDPNSLSIKELMAIGLGYEQQHPLVSSHLSPQKAQSFYKAQQGQKSTDHERIDQSLMVQAALLYSHKRGVLDLNQTLTADQVNTSIKQFKRHYQASIFHMRALKLFKQVKNISPIPTIESVAKAELLKVGLNPEMKVGTGISFLSACHNHHALSSCTNLLWKFYARFNNSTGKDNILIHPDFHYGDNNDVNKSKRLYQQLPEFKEAFKSEINRFFSSKHYKIYKRSIALLFRSSLYLRDDIQEEVFDLILNNHNAHDVKIAYYGIADQALMYFDPIKGETGLHSLVTLNDNVEVHSFADLQKFKNWLKVSKNRKYFRKLFSQIPESVWNDKVDKYFDDFIYSDNWIWRWNSAFWQKAIAFSKTNDQHPFEWILTKELNRYSEKNIANIASTQDLWLQELRQLLTIMPFIGQPVDMIWNLAKGNTEGALIDFAFIATELPQDIGLSMVLLKRASTIFRLKGNLFTTDAVVNELEFDFYNENLLTRENEFPLMAVDFYNNEIAASGNNQASAKANPLMLPTSHPVLLDEGYHVAYDAQGKRKYFLLYQDELIEVEPDLNDLKRFYSKSNGYGHSAFKTSPESGIVDKENRFKRAFDTLPSDQSIAWQHPVTGEELQVVKMQHTGEITAIKRSHSGILRPVDFNTGEILPNHDTVIRRKYANRSGFEYLPLQGEGVFAVAARREAKRGVIDILLDVIEIGNRGGYKLNSSQRQEIKKLLSNFFEEQPIHTLTTNKNTLPETRIDKTLTDSILKTAKGFNRLPSQPLLIHIDNVNTAYDYLLALYQNIENLQLDNIQDIGIWVKQFLVEQRSGMFHATFSEITTKRLVARINLFEIANNVYPDWYKKKLLSSGFPKAMGSLPKQGFAEVHYLTNFDSDQTSKITIPLNNKRTLTQQLLDYFSPNYSHAGDPFRPPSMNAENLLKKNLYGITQISIIDDNSYVNHFFYPKYKYSKSEFYDKFFDSVALDVEHIEHLVTPLDFDQVSSGNYPMKFSNFNGLHVFQQGTARTCGPTAMAMVFKDYGIEVDLGSTVYAEDSGYSTDMLYEKCQSEAPNLGVYMEKKPSSVLITLQEQLSSSGRARTAIVNYQGHFIVIDRFEGEAVFIRDPYMGTLSKLPTNEFLPDAFDHRVIYFPK